MIQQQDSRYAHHSITDAGATFSLPPNGQEDFTLALTQSAGWVWNERNLMDREIATNTTDKRLYIRMNDEIKEIATYPILSTYSHADGVDVWNEYSVIQTSGEATISFTYSNIFNVWKVSSELYARPDNIGSSYSGWAYQADLSAVYRYDSITFSVSQLGTKIEQHTDEAFGSITVTYSITNESVQTITVTNTNPFDIQWKWRYKITSL